MDLIKTVSEQLRQTIILLNESIKINVGGAHAESKNVQDQKSINLLRSMAALTQWT